MRASQNRLIQQLLVIGFMFCLMFGGLVMPSTSLAQSDKDTALQPLPIKPKPRTRQQLRTMRRQFRTWTSQNISNYRFDFQWSCFCVYDYIRPVEITVRNNEIVRVTYKDTGEQLEPENFERYRTIPGLFDLMFEAVDRKADIIDATFDANMGYPMTVYIDYSFQVIDEEMNFKVSNLQLLS